MAKVAFLGLGVMGSPMAGHLARKGHTVTVYNRTGAKAEAWVAANGGRTAATPCEAARGQEIVFACVGNDDDLRSVALGETGAFAGMERDAVFVDHTTASAEVARELAQAADALGLGFVDAFADGAASGVPARLMSERARAEAGMRAPKVERPAVTSGARGEG